ncbi:MAG: molybdopterin-dependent oxidoreductase [Flavobacteriales bacterium]
MKKISCIILTVAIALTSIMCNKERKTHSEKVNLTENLVSSENDQMSKDTCMKPLSSEDSIKYISKKLLVKGDVERSLSLTVDSLKKMNVATIENFQVVCQSGANMKTNKTCKGVLLRDILEKAKIKQQNHKDRNFYIVARATDNYKATFSWAEIFNNPTGDNVYVLFEENGQPIKAQGEMILICKNDIKTGARHVYWLNDIEVKKVE